MSSASPATVSRLGIVYLGAISPSTLLRPVLYENLSAVAVNTLKSHFGTVSDQVVKIKKEQKSMSSLLHAALIHFTKARTQAQCTYAFLASMCGQIEDPVARDDLIKIVYQLTDIWYNYLI